MTDISSKEYEAAFEAYIRTGDERGLERGKHPDGGYIAPQSVKDAIDNRLMDLSPLRSISRLDLSSAAIMPVREYAEKRAYPTFELYAMPAATRSFLEDMAVTIADWLADEAAPAFAEQETAALLNGDGVSKPLGLLREARVPEGERTGEKLGCLVGALDADNLIDVVYSLKAGYRQNAHWVMNRRTQTAIRKLKDGDGNFLWQPSPTASGRASLIGFDLVEAEDMPDLGGNNPAIAFGDFTRGFRIADRYGINILRDPYSNKPYCLFYTTKRIGGGVEDFDAIKLFGTPEERHEA